jgi:hypothetical protein
MSQLSDLSVTCEPDLDLERKEKEFGRDGEMIAHPFNVETTGPRRTNLPLEAAW